MFNEKLLNARTVIALQLVNGYIFKLGEIGETFFLLYNYNSVNRSSTSERNTPTTCRALFSANGAVIKMSRCRYNEILLNIAISLLALLRISFSRPLTRNPSCNANFSSNLHPFS
jgi:hypothetical protein